MSILTIIKPKAVEHQLELPFIQMRVPAGFPSPAAEYMGDTLDLNEHLITNKTATFFAEVSGDSMVGAGIHEGDLLVIDRSLKAKQDSIVVAAIDGEFTVKRLCIKQGVRLMPANDSYKPIILKGELELLLWGVVKAVIRKL